jgi:3-oxoacyl-[acyl-carrier-protein] synthase-1
VSTHPLAVHGIGLISSIGLTAPTTCAALRAKVNNPTNTGFIGNGGIPFMAHQVDLGQPLRGRSKLRAMVVMAIEEALADVPREEITSIPLLLCVAEAERPGRLDGLDDLLFTEVQETLGLRFAPNSTIVADGRVGIAVALLRARTLISRGHASSVLVAAVDSFVNWAALRHYQQLDRLLTPNNSNGFIPGEGAGAVLLGADDGRPGLVCTGIGFGVEAAHIDSEEPLRAEGLTTALRNAMNEAGLQLHDFDLRIADLSGEQYGFKEASLAVARLLRVRKEEFDIWHPAECTGELGAVAGLSCLGIGHAAARKGFAPGRFAILHFGNDGGRRAGIAVRLNTP